MQKTSPLSRNSFFMAMFLLFTSGLYAQQEFFEDNNGLSFAYQQGIASGTPTIYGFGGNAYFKKGIATGIALQIAEKELIPTFSLGFFGKQKGDISHIRPFLSTSIGAVDESLIVALDVGILRCFYRESEFPFSIRALFSASAGTYTAFGETAIDLVPAIGGFYTQTFFAHGIVNPFVGMGGAYDLSFGNTFFFFQAGLNVNV